MLFFAIDSESGCKNNRKTGILKWGKNSFLTFRKYSI
jgi:hypothetical protein